MTNNIISLQTQDQPGSKPPSKPLSIDDLIIYFDINIHAKGYQLIRKLAQIFAEKQTGVKNYQ